MSSSWLTSAFWAASEEDGAVLAADLIGTVVVGGGAQVDGVELVALAELQHLGSVAKDEHDALAEGVELVHLGESTLDGEDVQAHALRLGQLKSALLDVIVGGSVVDDDDALGPEPWWSR